MGFNILVFMLMNPGTQRMSKLSVINVKNMTRIIVLQVVNSDVTARIDIWGDNVVFSCHTVGAFDVCISEDLGGSHICIHIHFML